MRKIIPVLFTIALACSLSACTALGGNGGGSVSESSSATSSHKHQCIKTSAKDPTCLEEGNIDYWTCIGCDKIFNNQYAQKELSPEEVILEKLPHNAVHVEPNEASCGKAGNIEYWSCAACVSYFADEACQEIITNKTSVVLPKTPHDLVHIPAVAPNKHEDGNIEYWSCNDCENLYKDEACTYKLTLEKTILHAPYNIPDFVVEVDEGKDPVVLQLSDTQIIDAAQERPGRGGIDRNFYATDKMEERCFKYVRETINATNPDFIIITGDIVYGEFDDNGTSLTSFINFMESFQIPWAPVFGNHDNESTKGVDWQCEQFENAKYCLFDQKELTGNGNYSVAIAQGGELKRVFYMMDTNACGNASAESLNNGHTVNNYVGLKQDQVDWCIDQITELKTVSPETKISFAYHIQPMMFGEAYEKYGFEQSNKTFGINIDTHADKAEGDFGYIGAAMKGPWDINYKIFNDLKALGMDSIFVGHEHLNSASVVYEGVRFQFGQKSSEYDRYNVINSNGDIEGGYGLKGTSLIGGTVIPLSEEDGSILNPYIYYCGFENGQIDWSKYEKVSVDGLQYGGVNVKTAQMWADGAVTAQGVKFNDVNCYEVAAASQGKLYINPEELRGKTTLTFDIYVSTAASANLAGQGPFSIRLKPDDGSAANIAGAFLDGTKWYIKYTDNAAVSDVKIVRDTWQTFTVDITDIAAKCEEFSILVAAGNTVYLKNVTVK